MIGIDGTDISFNGCLFSSFELLGLLHKTHSELIRKKGLGQSQLLKKVVS